MLYENMLRFLLITFQPSLLDRTCLKCKTSLRCECWYFLMLLLLYRVNWPYLSKLQRFNEHFSTCQNNRALSASLSFHLRLDPSFWRSWLQKHIWFQTSTRIHQTHRFRKKNHSGEWFQKYAVSMCGLTGFVWTERRFLQKSIRIR